MQNSTKICRGYLNSKNHIVPTLRRLIKVSHDQRLAMLSINYESVKQLEKIK